jgi:DNA-binding transcriptional LysR family regulator
MNDVHGRPPGSLRQLEYFVAIADEGSFTRAAERLHVTQSALSHQVRDLERSLGGVLFERLPRTVRLTSLGRALLPDARMAVRAADRVVRTARTVVAAGEGELEIATVLSVAAGVLPATLRAWNEHRPRAVTRLHEFGHKATLEAAVAGGLADLALGPRPFGWSGPVVSLGAEEFMVILPAGDPLLDGSGSIDLSLLAARRWVLYQPEHGLSEIVSAACARAGFSPRGVVHTWQVEVAARLAASGLGPAMVPDNAVPPGLDAATLHQRRPVMRELAVYARSPFMHLAEDYLQVVLETDLRLSPLPDGAAAEPEHALIEFTG